MKNRVWLYVILICIFEIFWVFGFNMVNIWWYWIIILGVIVVDFYFFFKVCEYFVIGIVYVVFVGVGMVGIFLMDVFFFGGSFSVGKLFFIVMVVVGVIGLKLVDNKEEIVEGVV